MNHVVLTGRLTRDPESRKLASGKTVTEFSVATNDYRGGSEKAEYHPVVTWDRLAGLFRWDDELDLHESLRNGDAFDQLGEHGASSLMR